jgi:hypothetical protein
MLSQSGSVEENVQGTSGARGDGIGESLPRSFLTASGVRGVSLVFFEEGKGAAFAASASMKMVNSGFRLRFFCCGVEAVVGREDD